ncbi:hypothetical protein [Haliangium sp. UPWRP_2]|uniref:hypothetical protein n=1 Tax=Haliangium sp. UPWRP_2 TaxID=1931276 RepID=UPI000B53C9EB|nr:hypothetical protein [Haliangium sp. UPWRP_2]PSM31449.1 hypothetical protein BVG81_005320 [Haliangium sp. UPWRP_2]HNN95391.1 hypothetical protein [Pseudomonadota bacterium]
MSIIGRYAIAAALGWPTLAAVSLLPLSACSVVDVQKDRGSVNLGAKWALLPFVDYSDSTQAGGRLEDTLSSLLRTRLRVDITKYPVAAEPENSVDLDERQRYQRALSWAKKEGFTYGIGGSVNEWRYRSGADGEAAVGFTLHVVDLESGKTVWTATGARSGWGRETASGTAQRLLRDMITQLAGK